MVVAFGSQPKGRARLARAQLRRGAKTLRLTAVKFWGRNGLSDAILFPGSVPGSTPARRFGGFCVLRWSVLLRISLSERAAYPAAAQVHFARAGKPACLTVGTLARKH
jgi:hypothetical protein